MISRWDIGVWAALGALALTLAARTVSDGGTPVLEIRAPGGERRVDLTDAVHRVGGRLGEVVVEVRGGAARVVAAPCPEGRCLRMGPVAAPGDLPIVCLPSGVSVRVVGGGPARVDAVTG